MRWLLIASLLCLPMGMACTGGADEKTDDSSTEAAMKYECKGCGTTSEGPAKCDCGADMTPAE